MSRALKDARYRGKRYIFEIPYHVVSVDHPNGEWEAIFCKTEEQAREITALQARLEAAEAKCLELLSESVQTWRLLAMWRALSPYFDRENPYFPKHLEDNLRAAGEIE